MPKKSFGVIRVSTDLRFSTTFGDGSRKECVTRIHRPGEREFCIPGVVGYTGYRDRKAISLSPSLRQNDFLLFSPPGYTGFIPSKESESLFGKSYSTTASACVKHLHATT